jgi:hypothetical protein
MKKAIRQIVVMADGEVRIPPSEGAVAHGHRPADERIKIVVPAGKRWLLVELELELEEAEPPGPIGAMGAAGAAPA